MHIEKTLMKINMTFLIIGNELLEKCNEIWEKVKNVLKKEFDSESVYNEKYIKTEIKSYNGKNTTYFHNNKVRKESSECIYFLDSVKRKDENYYLPQVFLEECKYVIKEKQFLSILLMKKIKYNFFFRVFISLSITNFPGVDFFYF